MKWVLQIRKWLQTVIRRASGLVLMWMFCAERDVLQLSHPRQRKSCPRQTGPSDPSPVPPPQTSSSLPLHFQRASLRADTLDATPLGRSSQILRKICPLWRPLAPRVTWEGLLSRGWRLTIGCCCREPTGVGLFPINCRQLGQRPPEEAWHLICARTHSHT